MQSKYGRFPTFRDLNSSQPSEDHQVVTVDELRLGDVSEDRLDLARGLAQDPCRLGRGVVDEAASDLAAVGSDDAHDLAALEAAFDRGRADCEEALSVGDQRLHRARVEHDAPRRLQVIGEPLLARGDGDGLRGEERPDRFTGEEPNEYVALAAPYDRG